jgi:hypothetical protein
MHVTEGYSSTQHVRVAGHASRRRECLQRMEEDGVVPRRRGDRARRADVEPQPEHAQEYDEMDVQQQQQMEEELDAMEEDMEDGEPQRRWRGKRVVMPDPEPLDDYPGGPHDITMLWRYHVHVARKAYEGEIFINVKLPLICC